MPPIGRRISEWLRFGLLHGLASFTAVCLAFVLLYQVLAAGTYAGVLVSLASDKQTLRLLAVPLWLYGAPAATLWVLLKRSSAFPTLPFLGFYMVYAAALCLFYLHNVDPQYVSDFERMWDAANGMVAHGLHPVRGIIEQRAVFVLYPILKLFGPTHAALEFGNSILYVGVGLAGYDVVRRQAGPRSAQALCLVWLLSFEPLMAIAIPTHDLWGVAFTVASVWLLARAQDAIAADRPRWKVVAWLVGTGVFLALLQAQREIGVVLLLAVCFVLGYVELSSPRVAWRAFLIPAIVVLAFGASNVALRQVGLLAPKAGQQNLETSRFAGFATSFSNGRFPYGIAVRETFLKPLDPAAGASLSHAIVLSDLASQPADRVPNVVKRLVFIAVPGFQTYFYMAGAPKPRLAQARAISAVSAFVVFGLGAWATIATLRRPRRRMRPVTAVLVVFAGVMLLAFCTLSEVQPRYAFFMWVVAGVLVADGLFASPSRASTAPDSGQEILVPEIPAPVPAPLQWVPWQLVTLAGLALLGWGLLNVIYSPRQGRILSEWTYAIDQQAPAIGPEKSPAKVQEEPSSAFSYLKLPADQASSFGKLDLVLELPRALSAGDSVTAQRTVCTEGMRSLDFYISTPYRNLERSGAFNLTLSQDAKALWTVNLPAADHPILVQVPVAAGCSKLAFRLTSNVAMPAESWRRASRVEIIFPRLVGRR